MSQPSMKLIATFIFSLLFSLFSITSEGQSFRKEHKNWKKNYKKTFRIDNSSPLGRVGTWRLKFFKPKSVYKITANLEMIENGTVVSFPTTTGKTMDYQPYAKAYFNVYAQPCTLIIYRSAKAIVQKAYENYLFVPFRDYTSGDESFGGGRYIDLQVSDIKDNKLVIDFNRAYNPYCAYNPAYSCPVPPAENSLPLEIRAGEKTFKRRGRAAKAQ
jgi:uncharacterized protein (DUF1684 family)